VHTPGGVELAAVRALIKIAQEIAALKVEQLFPNICGHRARTSFSEINAILPGRQMGYS
jgi:hypothetical protein